MRPEMVENGVKFLRHPNVQTTPLSERVSFLEQKGMTKDEIQEAIERFQSGDASPPAAPAANVDAAYAQPPQMQQMQQQQPNSMLSAPMAIAAAAPMQQLIRRSRYPPYIRMLWTLSSLVGAASILGFLWNYAVQSGYIPWLRTPLLLTAGKVKEEEAENARKDEALMAGLTDMSAAIQAQTNELAKLCSSLDTKEQELATKHSISSQIATTLAEQTTSQAISELKAEVSTLKAILLAKNATSDGEAKLTAAETAAATTPSPSTNTQAVAAAVSAAPVVAAAPQPAIIVRAEKVESVLKLVRTQNSLEQLKLAAGLLTMYVKNLVENPDVPRYRRIAPGNANFKQKVEPLQHHEDLLKAIGFETNGLNLEWKWHAADRISGEFDDNLALLRAVLKALQSLTAPSASSSLSLEEIAHESLAEYRQKKGSAKGDALLSAGSDEPSTLAQPRVTPTSVPEPRANDLNSFMARLEKKASSANDVSAKKAAEKTEPVAAPAVSAEALLEEEEKPAALLLEDEEKLPASVVESAATSAGPSYPKSFNDVMELIQKGEKVPGIKDIEEKISVDSEAYLKSAVASPPEQKEEDGGDELVARAAAPAKPWEKVQG